ncbi:MAG: hypothetical protein WBX25_00820 [Rhodomicrobium sp.]
MVFQKGDPRIKRNGRPNKAAPELAAIRETLEAVRDRLGAIEAFIRAGGKSAGPLIENKGGGPR